MDLQSRLAELSSARDWELSPFGILTTRGWCCAQFRRVHFPRAERFDRRRGGYKPLGKVGLTLRRRTVIDPGVPAVAEPRNDRIGLCGYLVFRGSSTVGDWVTVPDDCSLATGGASRGRVLRV